MKRCILIFCSTIICISSFAQILRDTIFFANGTQIIGKLKKIRVGVVTFDPDDANDVTVNVTKVRAISAVRTVFRVETIRQQVYYGKLLPHPNRQYLYVIQGTDTSVIHMQEISILYPYKNSFFQRFSGNVGIGFTYTRSSDFGQANFNTKLAYTAKRTETTLSTSGIYTINDSTIRRDRQDISLKNNYYFNPTWFGTVFIAYQHNLELGLDRRFQEGFGIGNKYITSKHVYAWARTGLAFNQERNIEGISTGTLSEALGQIEFNFFRFIKPEINVTISQTFYYGLTQTGRIRNDGELDFYCQIIKDLKLDLTFYNNFDSQPPGAESRKFDFGIVFGLNFTFQ
ncbi:MAG: hypothetical protein C5B59_00380 [Bacteroidetes bacterium]|nr:MAG: hypothetical protein C5B59_00380 [Bacteroidota bacterium]